MKRPLIATAVAIAVGLIVFFSIRGTSDDDEKVYAEAAKIRRIEAVVTAPGEVDPKFKVNISAHVIGEIEHLYFNEGDRVHKGQKLIDLEKPAYEAESNRMNAQLQSSRIELARAKVQVETAQYAYDRAAHLRGEGIETQELLEKARLDLDNAKAAYASAQQGVHQSAASIVQADTNLSYTSIESPTDGTVVQLNTREGEVVIPGTMNNPGSVLAVIADMSVILVEADVDETEVVDIHPGQAATIKVDAIPNVEYAGHVTEIGASAAVRTGAGSGIRYFKVKIAFDHPDQALRPGMSAQVSIVTKTVPSALTVPIQSVVERVPGAKGEDDSADDATPKKKYVFVVRDGKTSMVPVTTGISDALDVAVTGAVKAGDQVITGPFRTLKKLKDGEKVQITKEDKTTGKKEAS